MTQPAVTFFTVADADNFVGLVAMVASLRLHGHHHPVIVLDIGFTSRQRAALAVIPACTAVECPAVAGRDPLLLAPYPFMLHAEGTVVYIDADVIVAQTLDPILEAAAQGMVCVAPDFLAERWFPEWVSIFTLTAPLRRQAYVNAGFVAFSTSHFPDLLRRWWECCDQLAPTIELPLPRTDPVALPDQDALNALLMSEVPRDRQFVLPPGAEPMTPRQLSRTKLVDADRLACTLDGRPTVLLHPVGLPKPWQSQQRQQHYRSGYELALRHLLAGSASTVQAGETQLPAWLQPGWRGDLTLRWLAVLTSVRTTKFKVKRSLLQVKRRFVGGARATADDPR